MCCRDRLWGRGVAAFTAFRRTRLEWSFTSSLISISHHWGGNRPHNLAELQCPCGPKGMLLVWLQMGQSWTLCGSRDADSRVEILIENWAVKLACLNVMKWLRVFELFIGCYLCQAGGKMQVQTIQRLTKKQGNTKWSKWNMFRWASIQPQSPTGYFITVKPIGQYVSWNDSKPDILTGRWSEGSYSLLFR